ncbi:MAG: hypothetical protein RIS47_1197 [Bacteroidota bacterium]
MKTQIIGLAASDAAVCAVLVDKLGQFLPAGLNLSETELSYVQSMIAAKERLFSVNQYSRLLVFGVIDSNLGQAAMAEAARKFGCDAAAFANKHKKASLEVIAAETLSALRVSVAEGAALGNYQFLRRFSKRDEKINSLNTVVVSGLDDTSLLQLNALVESVLMVRDLVNEPVNYMNAEQLADTAVRVGEANDIKVEVFDFTQIESLKMGGLLAVNKGSIDPPTFTVMEWKPANATNVQPVVLIGKGVTFDTGGLSLKPTAGSMDLMKSDMAGAAVVIGTLNAIAAAKLPVYVVALIPATDNRPGGNAYAPGDVITMHNGKTVEVLNTDAEGRMILADALSYSKLYNPELVIDLATLTGAAVRAIGKEASVIMGTADDGVFASLEESGFAVHERVVRFPFWDDYSEYIKSDIADMKNIGGADAGAITAGKFLQNFVESPWIHIDIAGPALLGASDSYRPKGGSGYGVRLLFEFLKKRAELQ